MKVTLKKMTIVAERVLRDRLLQLIREEGATGHTLIAVEGEGSRGVRASEFEGRNVQIDTIVAPEVCERIFERLAERYFEAYAVIAYAVDVEVLRGEKFVKP
jgi:nitrogen regulatory protein P-II 2